MHGVTVGKDEENHQQGLLIVTKIAPVPSLDLQFLTLEVFSCDPCMIAEDDRVAPKQHPDSKK